MKTAREILQEAGLPPPPKGEDRYYAVCPRCSTQRSPAHQKTKCLGIKITAEGVKWGLQSLSVDRRQVFQRQG